MKRFQGWSNLAACFTSGSTQKRFNPFRFTKNVLDFFQVTRLPEPVLLRIAKAFAYIWVGLHTVYKLARNSPDSNRVAAGPSA
jgi:hypothetical protein